VLVKLQTSEDFRLRLNEALKKENYDIDNMRYPEGYQEAPLAYDAVWAVALGKFLLYCQSTKLIMQNV
jgi:hypothetical protein